MILAKSNSHAPMLVIRPGSTEFDEQGRIKGSLDMPLSDEGHRQVENLREQIAEMNPQTIYSAPCESARQTAERLASSCGARVKVIEAFRNVDHGLWHGKLIDDLKRNHPKLYKRGQEAPDDICPPGGESLADARARIEKALKKVVKKSGDQLVAMVIPDPMARVVQDVLSGEEFSDLWKSETDAAQWSLVSPV